MKNIYFLAWRQAKNAAESRGRTAGADEKFSKVRQTFEDWCGSPGDSLPVRKIKQGICPSVLKIVESFALKCFRAENLGQWRTLGKDSQDEQKNLIGLEDLWKLSKK